MGSDTSNTSENEREREQLKIFETLINMGFDEALSLEASKTGYTDLNKLIEYIQQSQQTETQRSKPNEHKQENKIQALMDMGYDAIKVSNALIAAGSDYSVAANYLVSHEMQTQIDHCKNKQIESCLHWKRIENVIKQYKNDDIYNKNNPFLLDCYANLTMILDDFNHLLQVHGPNDDDFEFINNSIKDCKIRNCPFIRRNRRNRRKALDSNNKDRKYIVIEEILDKIHCYLYHSYDIGYRLTSSEKKMCLQNNDNDDDNGDTADNVNTLKLNNVLNVKRQILDDIDDSQQNANKFNKFNTNLGETKVMHKIDGNDDDNDDDEKKDEFSEHSKYSFGFRYYYWSYYQDLEEEDLCHNGCFGYKYRDWYIGNKYSSFFEEMTCNKEARMSLSQWNTEMSKAKEYLLTFYCKSLKANTKQFETKYKNYTFHPLEYGVKDKSPVYVHHLIAILIYCGYDHISYTFSSTFRLMDKDNQNIQCMKQRHCNFHFFAKYLRELVEIYGTMTLEKKLRTFWHGISSEKMLFESTGAVIFGPLSTTSKIVVAMHFANNMGMIVRMQPIGNLKYFDCCWISDFGNESELFFIGGFYPLTIRDIINVKLGDTYKQYMVALNVIDTMTTGRYFDEDALLFDKMVSDHYKYQSSPILAGAKPITDSIQELTFKLISHELGCDKMNNLPVYIQDLLHYNCINKKIVTINWKAMNTEIAEIYPYDFGGHLGFAFLRAFFCEIASDFEWIKMKVLTKLYPALETLAVIGMNKIHEKTFEAIYDYYYSITRTATNNKSKLTDIVILSERYSIQQMMSMIDKDKFDQIGCVLHQTMTPSLKNLSDFQCLWIQKL